MPQPVTEWRVPNIAILGTIIASPPQAYDGNPGPSGEAANPRARTNALRAIGTEEAMTRYGFNIRTRSGQRVDNICIMAANREEAERRLRQMYHHCQVISCNSESVRRSDPMDIEGVISIISTTDAAMGVPTIARSMLRKSGGH
jgi:hypothetical protein